MVTNVLKIEISCSQWKGSACTQSAMNFFLLSFGWGGGGGRAVRIFSFFLCSHHVLIKFSMDFPSGSQYIP
jgi:hypothetical protein